MQWAAKFDAVYLEKLTQEAKILAANIEGEFLGIIAIATHLKMSPTKLKVQFKLKNRI